MRDEGTGRDLEVEKAAAEIGSMQKRAGRIIVVFVQSTKELREKVKLVHEGQQNKGEVDQPERTLESMLFK